MMNAGGTGRQTLLRPEYIPRSKMTNGYGNYEKSLLLIRTYIASNFESSVWRFTADDMLSIKFIEDISNASFEMFIGHLQAGCLLLSRGETRFAMFELINASACTKDLMLSNDPRTIDVLLGILSRIQAFQAELRPVLRHFAAMANTVLGKLHPLTCISQLFSSWRLPCEDVIAPMSEAVIVQMSHWLGPLHLHSLIYRQRHTEIFGRSPLNYSITETMAPNINSPTEIYSHRSIKTQVEIGWIWYGRQAYIDSREYALGVLERSKLCVEEAAKTQLDQEAYELLACSQRALDDIPAAEENYIKYLSMVKSIHGESSGHLISALSNLESWYKEWGMVKKSTSSKERRENLQLAMTEIL